MQGKVRIFAVALGLLAASCARGQKTHEAGQALTSDQCRYFDIAGKVTICHATTSASHPYVIMKVADQACVNAHADHAGDYVTSTDPSSPLYDPSCGGQGCLPKDAPCDANLRCCSGLACTAGICTECLPGLVSYWRADNDARDSIGSNDGAFVNGPAFESGAAGQAFSFDGSNNFVQVPDSTSLRVESGDFTVSAWIKPNAVQQQVILFKGQPGMCSGYILVMNRFGSDLTLTKACVTDQPVSYQFQAGRWYHIAAVQQHRGPVSYYVNGILVGSYSNTNDYVASAGEPLRIGGGDTYFARKYDGLIDELAIFNRALSPSEIQLIHTGAVCAAVGGCAIDNGGCAQICTNGIGSAYTCSCREGYTLAADGKGCDCAPPTGAFPPGLVSYWRADNDASDSIGSNDGAFLNGASFASGVAGQAFSFDGSNNFVQVPDSTSLRVESGDFTISGWIKAHTVQQQVILFKGQPGMCSGYILVMNRFGSDLTLTKACVTDQPVSYPFQAGSWYHIAAVQQHQGPVSYYVNGVLVGSYSNTNDYVTSIGEALRIGGGDTYFARKYDGLIDELAIFNRALSACEIQLMHEGIAASP